MRSATEIRADYTGRLRYDPGWTLAALGGKEWVKHKETRTRRWGVFGKLGMHGGYFLPLINQEVSAATGRTRWLTTQKRLPTYYTIDLRISHTVEKSRYTRTLSLDLQNLTARNNISGYYYDRLLGEVKPWHQMGLVPVLAYRVEF